jgi:8-oxo-dGTP pyrophosphatase MutT (NUDIX family)
MYPTDLTVSAVVEDNGRYLIVEERAAGRTVLNQPGGHIEGGESPEVAVIRETLEETGCDVACGELIGVYLWIHPQTRQQFLRIAYVAKYLACDEQRKLDQAVVARKWLTRQELENRRDRLRSPLVLRCIRDYESGRRQTDILFSGMLPLQHHVDAVLATADLV